MDGLGCACMPVWGLSVYADVATYAGIYHGIHSSGHVGNLWHSIMMFNVCQYRYTYMKCENGCRCEDTFISIKGVCVCVCARVHRHTCVDTRPKCKNVSTCRPASRTVQVQREILKQQQRIKSIKHTHTDTHLFSEFKTIMLNLKLHFVELTVSFKMQFI